MLQILIIILVSYLVGSFPTSIVVSKVFFKKDIRNYGSGNAGGTNALRIFGWKVGVSVMLFDVGKGVIATLFVSQLFTVQGVPHQVVQLIAGCSAVIGHIWTVFAHFKGGKGVGTAAGMLASLYPVAILVCVIVFAIVVVLTGYVSAGSMSAALTLPIILWIMNGTGWRMVHPVLLWFSIPLALLIFFTHRGNIKRLLNGTENRFEKVRIFSKSNNRE